MKEKMIRGAAFLLSLLLVLGFWLFPRGEEEALIGSTGSGRKKYILSSGESVTWTWAPEIHEVSEIVLLLSGLKDAQGLVLKAEAAGPDGKTVSTLTQAVAELGDRDEITLEGRFSGNTFYSFTVSAEGDGKIKLRGEETDDGFIPSMNWAGTERKQDGMLLYFAAGFLLIGLIPIPAAKSTEHRPRKLLLLAGLILLSSFWLIQKLGADAFSLNEATVFAWVLHDAAWLFLGIMGKLLFGWNVPLEWKAAVGVLLLGILFIFAIVPKSPPDEYAHFTYSYRVSNDLLFRENRTVGDARDQDLDSWGGHLNSANGYSQVVKRLPEKREEDKGKTFSLPQSVTYPVMYLPQAIGLSVGRLLQANALLLFYLGRFFNLLFYTLCVFFAVREIPEKKELFFGIGMMPMAIHQAASFSYDAFTNGMALLFTALVFRAARSEKPMSKKEFFSLLIVGVLLAPAKVGYAVFAGLLFFIPRKRFVFLPRPAAVWGIILAMLAAISVFWLPSTLAGDAVHTIDAERFTAAYILQHPLSVIEILSVTMEERLDGWLLEATGQAFSGYSLWIPGYIALFYLALLFAASLKTDSDPGKCISFGHRMGILVIIGISVLLVEIVELVTWTEVTSLRVEGIQGRYFIPIIPLVFLALETCSLRRSSRMDTRKLLLALCFLQVFTLDNIVVRTMWN